MSLKLFLMTVRIAIRSLRRNTLRSVLTMLGIIFGVAAVIPAPLMTPSSESQRTADAAVYT